MNSIKIASILLALMSESLWAGEASSSLQVLSYKKIYAAARAFEDKRADHKYKQRLLQATVIGGMVVSFVWGMGSGGPQRQESQVEAHSSGAVAKGMFYTMGSLGLTWIGWCLKEGFLRTLSSFMLNIVTAPVRHFLQYDCALRAADFWLLAEQVKGSSAHYVVVSADLAQFVGLLQAWDLLALQVPQHPAISQALAGRLCMLTEDLLGFICMQALADDDKAMHWYFSTMVVQLDQALVQWRSAWVGGVVGQPDLERATSILQDQFHAIMRILITFPFYRIHSYPLSVVIEDSVRSFATRHVTQKYTLGT